jgi:hypothetical protein
MAFLSFHADPQTRARDRRLPAPLRKKRCRSEEFGAHEAAVDRTVRRCAMRPLVDRRRRPIGLATPELCAALRQFTVRSCKATPACGNRITP